MKYINMTPHAIKLNDGRVFPPSGISARVDAEYSEFNESLVCQVKYGCIVNMPVEPEDDALYIVSGLVGITQSAALAREDGSAMMHVMVVPATGHKETKRSKDGQVESVPGFVMV